MSTNEAKNKYQRQLRVERKEWGVCIECGKRPPFEGRVRCEVCLCRDLLAHHKTTDSDARKENLKKQRAERRAAGLCTDCGKPVYKEYSRCYEHYLRNKRASDNFREQHKTGRVKPWNPPPPPHKPSAEHPWHQMNKLIKRRDEGEYHYREGARIPKTWEV